MNILINRSDAIGDTILTLPMASAIKKSIPNCKVYFLISKRCEGLLEHHPYIDGFLVIKDGPVFRRVIDLFKYFRKFKINCYFYVGGGHLASLISFLLMVKIRGGLKSRWPSFLFLNRGLRQKRGSALKHESDYNLDLLTPLFQIQHEKKVEYAPIIVLDNIKRAKDLKSFKEMLSQKGFLVTEKLFFVHPGMTGHTLNWPPEMFASLIKEILLKKPNKYFFIISYTPSDEKYIKRVRNELEKDNKNIYFFDGSKKGLKHYMNILSYANFFIGPSTGTLHIANALKIPHLGIYSPIKVQSAKRWGPFPRRDVPWGILSPPKDKKDESYDESDMLKISVLDAYQKIFEIMEE